MVQIPSMVMIAVVLVFGQCDLIGHNRLGNNVYGHLWNRPGMAKGNYQFQLFRWILESNDLSVGDKKIWLQKIGLNIRPSRNKGLRRQPNNRLHEYTRSMALS